MTSELWQRVPEILEQALELDRGARPAFLEQACGDDPELLREVESLLEAGDEAGEFIEQPVLSLRPRGIDAEDTRPRQTDAREHREAGSGVGQAGDRVGPYKILRELGRGGMGKVLLAMRADDEFERIVAIKILQRDKDSDDIVGRFRHERQILASLDHPNIAELFDGGSTRDGLPYFVMEYVEGIRIDRYCDQHRLGIQPRLELFLKVCAAVHSAHQSLVVHRDLKPGNILVTADGEPKLLDFGIAKLLVPDISATDTTAERLTVTGIEPMTPDYASPEQIKGEAITTASDVYSLGVLLYQLLTGHRPYGLAKRTMPRLFKAITEDDPRKPSDAVLIQEQATGDTTVVLTAESVSLHRGTEPRTLKRSLAGDLDAVVLKALRKEPRERYGSVEQLAGDLRRHLQGRPVAARQGTRVYQASKFLQRHRMKLAAAVAVLMMIVLGVRSMVLASQAKRERQVAQSLSTLFQSLQSLDPRAADDPDFAASLHAEVSRNIDDLELAAILSDQAHLLEVQGGYATAEVLYREALDMAVRVVGEIHAKVAVFMNNLAVAMAAQGKYAEAEALYRDTLEVRIAVHGRESEQTARTLNNLGTLLQNKGDLDAAEPYLRESLDIRRKLYDPEAPQVATAINNFAFFLQARGDYAAAEIGFRQALGIFRARYGLEHRTAGIVTRNLAALLTAAGDHENAEKMARRALEILSKSYLKHWRVADAESVLGGVLVALERYDEAEPMLRDSYTVISATKGPNARETREALARLERLEAAR